MLRKISFLLFSVVIINTCQASSDDSDLPSTRGVTSSIVEFFNKYIRPSAKSTQHATPEQEKLREQKAPQTETVFILNAAVYPAHQYAREGNLEQLKILGETNADELSKLDDQGNTPLHHAAQHNHLEVVQYLLKQYQKNTEKGFGAIVDLIMQKNNNGKTAAALAAAAIKEGSHYDVWIYITKKVLSLEKQNNFINNAVNNMIENARLKYDQ